MRVVYPTYETVGLKKFLNWACWACENATAKADIVSYGFIKLSSTTLQSCGELTAGD
jgi:hypothetical protein